MICVAIAEKSIEKCLSILNKVEMAEIRLDLTLFGANEIKKVFAHSTPTIATCRPDKIGKEEQLSKLGAAIQSGANYVDIELEASRDQQQTIIEVARKNKCKVIISYHNFEETPGLKELYQIVDQCYLLGADIAKIATLSNSIRDNARLLSLYSIEKSIVTLGMGVYGKITRIMAEYMGAPFTFASMDEGKPTAPGQITYSEMKRLFSEINTYLK